MIYAFDDELAARGAVGDAPGPAAGRASGAQRRGAADPPRQPLGARRRGPALHPRGLQPHLEQRRIRVSRLTYTNAAILPHRRRRAVRAATARGITSRSTRNDGPVAPVNLALSGLLAIEAAALRVVDMPLGSSLLTLAQKRNGPRRPERGVAVTRSTGQASVRLSPSSAE